MAVLDLLERLFLHHPLTKSYIEEHLPGTAKETRDNTARNRAPAPAAAPSTPGCCVIPSRRHARAGSVASDLQESARPPRPAPAIRRASSSVSAAASAPVLVLQSPETSSGVGSRVVHSGGRSVSDPGINGKSVAFSDTGSVIISAPGSAGQHAILIRDVPINFRTRRTPYGKRGTVLRDPYSEACSSSFSFSKNQDESATASQSKRPTPGTPFQKKKKSKQSRPK